MLAKEIKAQKENKEFFFPIGRQCKHMQENSSWWCFQSFQVQKHDLAGVRQVRKIFGRFDLQNKSFTRRLWCHSLLEISAWINKTLTSCFLYWEFVSGYCYRLSQSLPEHQKWHFNKLLWDLAWNNQESYLHNQERVARSYQPETQRSDSLRQVYILGGWILTELRLLYINWEF